MPSVLVHGAYLVRSAAINGSTLALKGDLNSTTVVDIFAPSSISSVTWNGVAVDVSESEFGGLTGSVSLPGTLDKVEVPVLEELDWVCADSLPELAPDFDDSDWVDANKTSTQRPQKPTNGKVSSLLHRQERPLITDFRTSYTRASELIPIYVILLCLLLNPARYGFHSGKYPSYKYCGRSMIH